MTTLFSDAPKKITRKCVFACQRQKGKQHYHVESFWSDRICVKRDCCSPGKTPETHREMKF